MKRINSINGEIHMSENNNTVKRTKKRVRHTLRLVRHLFEGMISAFFIIFFVLHFRALMSDQTWLIIWILGLSLIIGLVWVVVESSLVESIIDLTLDDEY